MNVSNCIVRMFGPTDALVELVRRNNNFYENRIRLLLFGQARCEVT